MRPTVSNDILIEAFIEEIVSHVIYLHLYYFLYNEQAQTIGMFHTCFYIRREHLLLPWASFTGFSHKIMKRFHVCIWMHQSHHAYFYYQIYFYFTFTFHYTFLIVMFHLSRYYYLLQDCYCHVTIRGFVYFHNSHESHGASLFWDAEDLYQYRYRYWMHASLITVLINNTLK